MLPKSGKRPFVLGVETARFFDLGVGHFALPATSGDSGCFEVSADGVFVDAVFGDELFDGPTVLIELYEPFSLLFGESGLTLGGCRIVAIGVVTCRATTVGNL